MLDPTFASALAAIVPPSALLTAPEDTRPYECDGLTLYREQPAAVVLPDNEAQDVLQWAALALLRAGVANTPEAKPKAKRRGSPRRS